MFGTLVVPGEAHEMVYLDHTEKVIDHIDDVIQDEGESRGAIEVYDVEDGHEEEDLELLGGVIDQEDGEHEEEEASHKESWEVVNVVMVSSKVNASV